MAKDLMLGIGSKAGMLVEKLVDGSLEIAKEHPWIVLVPFIPRCLNLIEHAIDNSRSCSASFGNVSFSIDNNKEAAH